MLPIYFESTHPPSLREGTDGAGGNPTAGLALTASTTKTRWRGRHLLPFHSAPDPT